MIRGIDHLGIAVPSIAEALPFYRQLGLEVEAIEEVPHEQVRVAILPCGESRIELLEPTSEESPIARFLAKKGPGIHHVCFKTDDVRAEGAGLASAGFQLLRPEPTPGADGCWVNFIHPKSAGGVLTEISEPRGAGDGHH